MHTKEKFKINNHEKALATYELLQKRKKEKQKKKDDDYMGHYIENLDRVKRRNNYSTKKKGIY